MSVYVPLSASFLVFIVFVVMTFSYTQKRAEQAYAKDKVSAPSIAVFNWLSKFLFVSSMLLTITCFWVSSPWMGKLYHSTSTVCMGVVLVLWGYMNLCKAFNSLQDNYSPLFDAYRPFKIVTEGAYDKIRHPIYLYNLFVSFGLALASGSFWVWCNALVGLAFILRAIQIEEAYLLSEFPDYDTYKTCTWRMIPYIY